MKLIKFLAVAAVLLGFTNAAMAGWCGYKQGLPNLYYGSPGYNHNNFGQTSADKDQASRALDDAKYMCANNNATILSNLTKYRTYCDSYYSKETKYAYGCIDAYNALKMQVPPPLIAGNEEQQISSCDATPAGRGSSCSCRNEFKQMANDTTTTQQWVVDGMRQPLIDWFKGTTTGIKALDNAVSKCPGENEPGGPACLTAARNKLEDALQCCLLINGSQCR